jgi:hypothetical protein
VCVCVCVCVLFGTDWLIKLSECQYFTPQAREQTDMKERLADWKLF